MVEMLGNNWRKGELRSVQDLMHANLTQIERFGGCEFTSLSWTSGEERKGDSHPQREARTCLSNREGSESLTPSVYNTKSVVCKKPMLIFEAPNAV